MRERKRPFLLGLAFETLLECGWRRDDVTNAVARDETFAGESAEHQRDRLTGRADHLAEQPILTGPENDLSGVTGVGSRPRHPEQGEDQPLLHAERRELAHSVEQGRTLPHDLPEQGERLLRLFTNVRTEGGTAQMERLGLSIGSSVGGVASIAGEPLGAERLAAPGHRRHEAAAGLHAVAKHDAAPQDDKDAIGPARALVHHESRGPGRARSVRGDGRAIRLRQFLDVVAQSIHYGLCDSWWCTFLQCPGRLDTAREFASIGIVHLALISVHPATQTERRAGVFSIAILGADTMLAALPATPVQLAHACLQVGYELAVPASWGDELIAAECLRLLPERGSRPAIMCACPHTRNELLAVGPDLAPMLVPLVSPPVATARYLHALYGRERLHLTYVGACPAGADAALDAHCTPAEFLAWLATEGIIPTDQPTVFDSVLPPDRRRFFSIAGGVPSAEQLWSAGSGRALVEVNGDDYLIDLAQHLLSHECALIDLAPRLGCACSGASSGIPARSARAAVAVIDPPRASSAVVDMTVAVALIDPIVFDVESVNLDAGNAAASDVPDPVDVTSEPPVVAPTESRVRESTAALAAPPRRRSPAAGIRSIQGSVPIAHVAGRRLPRAYVGARRPLHGPVSPARIEPPVSRVPPTVPESAGDENGRSRHPARVAASPRSPGQAAAVVAKTAQGLPERMGDGPRS